MVVDGSFGKSYMVRKGKSFPEYISTARRSKCCPFSDGSGLVITLPLGPLGNDPISSSLLVSAICRLGTQQ